MTNKTKNQMDKAQMKKTKGGAGWWADGQIPGATAKRTGKTSGRAGRRAARFADGQCSTMG